MNLQDIKSKQIELNSLIQDLILEQNRRELSVYEKANLNNFIHEFESLQALIPIAEEKELKEKYGEDYIKLWKEKKELQSKKGPQGLEASLRLNEIQKSLSEIENKK